MFGATDIVVVAMVPLLGSILVFTVARRVNALRECASLLAIGLGFVLGAVAMVARDHVPLQSTDISAVMRWQRAIGHALVGFFQPQEARGWLVLLTPLAMLIAGFERPSSRWRLVAWIALFVALPVRLQWGSVYFVSAWSPGGAVLRVTAIAAAMLTVHIGARWYTREGPSAERNAPSAVEFCFVCTVVGGGAAVVLLLTGSKTYGELAGTFCFASIGSFVSTFVATSVGENVSYENAIGLAIMIVGGLLVLGCSFAETSLWQATGLGVAAGMALLLISRAPGSRLRRWTILAMMTSVVLAICLQAGMQFQADIRSEANPYEQYQ